MIEVMVVSRSEDVRDGLSMVLGLADDIDVIAAAESPVDALELACRVLPDVMLVDLEMPGREGYDIIRQIRRCCPSIRTIALTAHDIPAVLENALQAGAVMVMVKGVGVSEMVSVIEAASHA